MSVEQKIIDNSSVMVLKALASRAAKAVKEPATGVKIIVKGAYYVIRDCAQVTVEYLPLKLYGCYENPIEELKGKFTKHEIEVFVSGTLKKPETKQLCSLMLLDAKQKNESTNEIPENGSDNVNFEDIYGDYGSDSVNNITEPFELNTETDNTSTIVDVLIKAFKAK